MNIDWVKSVDSHNISLLGLENKFRTKAELSTADVFDDKIYQKSDYRTNFSVDNEDVNDEANKKVKEKHTDEKEDRKLIKKMVKKSCIK